MVEMIGSATVRAGISPVTNVPRLGATAPVATTAKPGGTDATKAPGAMASAMAATPPVDSKRVQEIKTALANGTFPLSPSTIADQFIALRYDWMSQNEQA